MSSEEFFFVSVSQQTWPPRVPKRGLALLREKLSALATILWGRPKLTLLIVVLLEMCVVGVELSHVGDSIQRRATDLFMYFNSGSVINPDKARPLDFVDIDDNTFMAKEAAGSTNRRFIAELIDKATKQHPIAIIVDLDLSIATADDPFLKQNICKASGPPLIFTRSLRRDNGRDAPLRLLAWSLSGYEQPLCQPPAADFFASAGFPRDSDGVVRAWYPAEPYWQESSQSVETMPSVELLLLAMVDRRDKAGCNTATRLPADCDEVAKAAAIELQTGARGAFQGDSGHITPGLVRKLTFSSRGDVRLVSGGKAERLFYTVPWRGDSDRRHTDSSQTLRLCGEANATPLIRYYTATRYPDPGVPPADRACAQRIVLIGGSNGASRDSYITPLGQMPGGMVVLNSINSLLQQGQMHEPPLILRFALGVLFGMLVAALLHQLRFGIAVALAIIIPFVLTYFLARNLLPGGVWLDFNAPIVGIALHAVWEAMTEFRAEVSNVGFFKAFLRPQRH